MTSRAWEWCFGKNTTSTIVPGWTVHACRKSSDITSSEDKHSIKTSLLIIHIHMFYLRHNRNKIETHILLLEFILERVIYSSRFENNK